MIQIINQEQAASVIETRTPRGLFLLLESDSTFTAIDNETGDAWTENFPDKETAERWLEGERAVTESHDPERHVVCPQCGSPNFWLLTVATEIYASSEGLRFKAFDAATNREAGFRCYECDHCIDEFDGLWEFKATIRETV